MIQKAYKILSILLLFSPLNLNAQESYEVHLKSGDFYHASFDNLNALLHYKKAYDLNPENFEIIRKIILAYNDCGEDFIEIDENRSREFFSNSVKYAEIAKEKFPNETDTYLLLGLSYGNLSRYTNGKRKLKLARNVETNFKKMVELRPDYAPPYIGLGIYYREVTKLNFFLKLVAKSLLGGLPTGTLEDSKAMLEKALELAPGKVFTHYELAITYLDIGDIEKVRYHLEKVLDLPVTDHLDLMKKTVAVKILMDLS